MNRNRKIYSFFYNHREILIILSLLVITFCVYFQIHQFEFVSFDDNEYVYENPNVTSGITVENIIWAFTAFHSNNWHPLTWISHMLDCQIFGLNPGWHHLVNLFFHLANSILLFLVFRKMTGGLWQSAFVAAVFAVHPLHVESVVWISERKDVLSTFFGILTIWSYAWYVKKRNFKRYLLPTIFFALGLLSKPMLVTLPFVLLLLDYWPLNQFQSLQTRSCFCNGLVSKKRLILEKMPLFFLSIVSCVLTFFAQRQGGVVKSLETFSVSGRISNSVVAYISYIGKIFYPVKLAFIYPYQENLPLWKVAAACLFIAVITFMAIRMAARRPYFIVGWFWFLGTLAPVIGIIQVGMQSMADRYTYIPMIGILIPVAWTVTELAEKREKYQLWIVASVAMVLAICSALTYRQAGYWKNSDTMLRHTLAVTSNNYIAHDSLGVNLFMQGKIDEAISHYEKAIQLYPKNFYTYFNLGLSFYQKGNLNAAIQNYLHAIALEPNFAKAQCNLGAAYFQKEEYEKAKDHYLAALKINPDYVDAYFNLGVLYYDNGELDAANPCLLRAVTLKPEFMNAYYYLGMIHDKIGDKEKSVQYFQHALNLSPNNLDILMRLANEFIGMGKFADAEKTYSKILQLAPNNVMAHHNIGVSLFNMGKVDQAISHYVKAIKIQPNFVDAYFNLGGSLYSKGNIDGAINCFKQALRLKPDYPEAKRYLLAAIKLKNQQAVKNHE